MTPSVFTIPPGTPFVDVLAAQLVEETAHEPLALSAMLILLPTRRACRALRDAFLRCADGRPLLLPRLRPLGDGDEDDMTLADALALDLPPAVPPLRRQLLLARLILTLGDGRGGAVPTADQATQLAGELGRLLDQVQTEELGFERLAQLVPEEYAAHWQVTVDFLKILTDHWPDILAAEGWIDPVLRRNRLLDAQCAQWTADPPDFPVIAAGSTGSIPATARLLATVARLPRGRLILPGLDQRLSKAERAVLDQSHPQYGLYRLLDRLGIGPDQVAPWPRGQASPRAWLIAEAMRPAKTTEMWRSLRRDDAGTALAGVVRLDCPGTREEAGVIALLMREALEQPQRTAALVTPDRALARRVAAELGRYDIDIDDSAGRAVDLTSPGTFLLLTAAMVAEQFAPHATLAALKHPLAAGGLTPGLFRTRVRQLEQLALRGPRPAPGIDGLIAAVGPRHPEVIAWLAPLARQVAPFARLTALGKASLADLVHAHVAFAEALAADDRHSGAERLWHGEAGEAAQGFIADLAQAADALPPLAGQGYGGLLRGLMGGVTVRPYWGSHPRLAIWGPLEARLQQSDLLIMGGLNEGAWPSASGTDPWMSRPMRDKFGLPPMERRIGLAAHDFAQAFCAPEVVMTRAARAEGTPTVPSRWLLRLDAVLRACGLEQPWNAPHGWLGWQNALDRAELAARPLPPAPRPPLAARPREMSATAIETWMRDPYAIYARRILALKALEPIDADPGAADYGTMVHAALDRFVTAYPRGPLPAHALDILLALGRESFAEALAHPGLMAFWWPRFQRIAAWFVAHDSARRPALLDSRCEVSGSIDLAAPAGSFRITAKADRIDRLRDGGLALIDYKTGAPPSMTEVAAGFAPQLPIEAVIASHGGFSGLPSQPVHQLLYWRLRGGDIGGEERMAGEDPGLLAVQALAGVSELVRLFDDESTAYEARPHPDKAPKYSDYLHLARVKEWASGEEGEE